MAKKKEVELQPEGFEEELEGKKSKKAKAKKEKQSKKDKGGRVSRGIANPVRNLIVTAVVSALLGAAFFIKPYEVSLYLGYGAGGILGLVGIIYILMYFLRKPVSGVYRSEFVIGLVALLAGAYIALSGLVFSTGGIGYIMIIRIIGVMIVADGLLKVQYAVDIGRMKFKPWWVALIFAILSVGIGVLTVTDFSGKAITASTTAPVSMIYTLGVNLGLGSSYGSYAAFFGGMKMLGIAFWANAAFDIATLIIIAVRNHKAAKAEAIAEASAMIAESKKEEIALPEEPIHSEPEEIVFQAAPMPDPVFAPPAPPAEPVIHEAPTSAPAEE